MAALYLPHQANGDGHRTSDRVAVASAAAGKGEMGRY
jgi:hypothetical protein